MCPLVRTSGIPKEEKEEEERSAVFPCKRESRRVRVCTILRIRTQRQRAAPQCVGTEDRAHGVCCSESSFTEATRFFFSFSRGGCVGELPQCVLLESERFLARRAPLARVSVVASLLAPLCNKRCRSPHSPSAPAPSTPPRFHHMLDSPGHMLDVRRTLAPPSTTEPAANPPAPPCPLSPSSPLLLLRVPPPTHTQTHCSVAHRRLFFSSCGSADNFPPPPSPQQRQP